MPVDVYRFNEIQTGRRADRKIYLDLFPSIQVFPCSGIFVVLERPDRVPTLIQIRGLADITDPIFYYQIVDTRKAWQ
jgi:hypothetical protein